MRFNEFQNTGAVGLDVILQTYPDLCRQQEPTGFYRDGVFVKPDRLLVARTHDIHVIHSVITRSEGHQELHGGNKDTALIRKLEVRQKIDS